MYDTEKFQSISIDGVNISIRFWFFFLYFSRRSDWSASFCIRSLCFYRMPIRADWHLSSKRVKLANFDWTMDSLNIYSIESIRNPLQFQKWSAKINFRPVSHHFQLQAITHIEHTINQLIKWFLIKWIVPLRIAVRYMYIEPFPLFRTVRNVNVEQNK